MAHARIANVVVSKGLVPDYQTANVLMLALSFVTDTQPPAVATVAEMLG